jgi:translation initiation factor IF-2
MIKKLFLEGKMVTVNTDLSFDDAAEIALEYNFIADEEEKVDVIEELMKDIEDPEDSLTPRPPVVCVMGHVDHGKTSLLDAIRKTSVTEGEAGGITQHIGAYVVNVGDQKITFLDTPGHEAFTAMRMRGAKSTDIAILVVAADDGVMPQTVEAINHAKAAGIEIIVAINKIDKESANVERVKQELIEYGLVSEDWGGSTVFCPVSAHTKEGLDNLLEMILLTAEMLELKANKNRKARGVVIEARLDKGRGPVATVLVQKGTLKVGDSLAIGNVNGRVRAMIDDKQKRVKEALPSTPVEIQGLNGVPNSGEIFIATENEKEARQISEAFITRGKESLIAETKSRMSLDDLFNKMQEGNVKELNLIIKADVQGSVEAVKQSLLKLSNDEIVIKCIHSGVGAINESDVTLASASDAIIIGFNIRPDAQAKEMADREKVDVRLYRVIYNAIEDIESAMKGMLDPIFEEKVIGHAEVRQTYKASGVGTIAGSYVLDGVIQRNSSVRITRQGEQIFEGKLASLKRFKDDVKEVKSGFECGLVFENFNDIKEEDQIEVYTMVEVPR